MKYKPLFIYLFISSVFLTLVSSIWKIMATLQGLKLTEINLNINFLLALGFIMLINLFFQYLCALIDIKSFIKSYLL